MYCNAEGLRQGLAGAALFGKPRPSRRAKRPQDGLRGKHPLQNAAGCQFVRQPDADPFRPAACHLAAALKGLEDPDLRISELATCSGRRMRGGRTRGRSEGLTPPFLLSFFGCDRESRGCHPEDGCRSRQLTLTHSLFSSKVACTTPCPLTHSPPSPPPPLWFSGQPSRSADRKCCGVADLNFQLGTAVAAGGQGGIS